MSSPPEGVGSFLRGMARTALKVGADRIAKRVDHMQKKVEGKLKSTSVGRSMMAKVDAIQNVGGVRTVGWLDTDAETRARFLNLPAIGAVEIICHRGLGIATAPESLGVFCRLGLEGQVKITHECDASVTADPDWECGSEKMVFALRDPCSDLIIQVWARRRFGLEDQMLGQAIVPIRQFIGVGTALEAWGSLPRPSIIVDMLRRSGDGDGSAAGVATSPPVREKAGKCLSLELWPAKDPVHVKHQPALHRVRKSGLPRPTRPLGVVLITASVHLVAPLPLLLGQNPPWPVIAPYDCKKLDKTIDMYYVKHAIARVERYYGRVCRAYAWVVLDLLGFQHVALSIMAWTIISALCFSNYYALVPLYTATCILVISLRSQAMPEITGEGGTDADGAEYGERGTVNGEERRHLNRNERSPCRERYGRQSADSIEGMIGVEEETEGTEEVRDGGAKNRDARNKGNVAIADDGDEDGTNYGGGEEEEEEEEEDQKGEEEDQKGEEEEGEDQKGEEEEGEEEEGEGDGLRVDASMVGPPVFNDEIHFEKESLVEKAAKLQHQLALIIRTVHRLMSLLERVTNLFTWTEPGATILFFGALLAAALVATLLVFLVGVLGCGFGLFPFMGLVALTVHAKVHAIQVVTVPPLSTPRSSLGGLGDEWESVGEPVGGTSAQDGSGLNRGQAAPGERHHRDEPPCTDASPTEPCTHHRTRTRWSFGVLREFATNVFYHVPDDDEMSHRAIARRQQQVGHLGAATFVVESEERCT